MFMDPDVSKIQHTQSPDVTYEQPASPLIEGTKLDQPFS